jgi:hypothetical protein
MRVLYVGVHKDPNCFVEIPCELSPSSLTAGEGFRSCTTEKDSENDRSYCDIGSGCSKCGAIETCGGHILGRIKCEERLRAIIKVIYNHNNETFTGNWQEIISQYDRDKVNYYEVGKKYTGYWLPPDTHNVIFELPRTSYFTTILMSVMLIILQHFLCCAVMHLYECHMRGKRERRVEIENTASISPV